MAQVRLETQEKKGALKLIMQMGLHSSLGSPGNIRDKLKERLR